MGFSYMNDTLPEELRELVRNNKDKFYGMYVLRNSISIGLIFASVLLSIGLIFAWGLLNYISPVHSMEDKRHNILFLCLLIPVVIIYFARKNIRKNYFSSLWKTACRGNSGFFNCVAKAYAVGMDGDVTFFSVEKNYKYLDYQYDLTMSAFADYVIDKAYLPENRKRLTNDRILAVYCVYSPFGKPKVGDEVYLVYRREFVKEILKVMGYSIGKLNQYGFDHDRLANYLSLSGSYAFVMVHNKKPVKKPTKSPDKSAKYPKSNNATGASNDPHLT